MKGKADFPVKKNFWPILSCIIERDKPRGTFYMSPEGFLTIPLEVIGSFF